MAKTFFLLITQKAINSYLGIAEAVPGEPGAEPGQPGAAQPGAQVGMDGQPVEEVFVYRPPSPRPWQSYGSEIEIDEVQVENKRPLIKLRCTRKRKYFGQPVSYGLSTNTDDSQDIQPDPARTEMTHRVLLDCAVQSVNNTESTGAQTTRAWTRNQWVQTKPREKEPDEKTLEAVAKGLENVVPLIHLCLQQNEICNVFTDCWSKLGTDDDGFGSKSDGHLREYQSFTDLKFSKDRRLTCIDWHPELKGVVAVSCAQRKSLYERIEQAPKLLLSKSLVLIWSFSDPIHPCLLLQAPSDVYSFQFSSAEPHIIAGGCLNGQVVIWDISDYQDNLRLEKSQTKKKTSQFGEETGPETPIVMWKAVSAIEQGHKAPITQIQWLPAGFEVNNLGQGDKTAEKRQVQLFSVATDGSFAIWDIRPPPAKKSRAQLNKRNRAQKEEAPTQVDPWAHLNLVWKPLLRAIIPRGDTGGHHNPVRVSILPIAPDGSLRNEYFLGTEDGDILYGGIKLVKDGDSGKMVAPRPLWIGNHHSGPIASLARSPFFDDVVLSVGGWSFAIWKEGEKDVGDQPLLAVHTNDKKYTAGVWSPSRPGIFFVGTQEGNIEVWDLLEKTHEPSVIQNVTTSRVSELKPWIVSPRLHLLGVSDSVGTLHILELPWNLRQPTPNEISSVQGYISREVQRIVYFNERREGLHEEISTTVIPESDMLENIQDDDLEEDFKSYLKMESQILEEMAK